MKKIIKAFFKEIVPIVVGILIALYINNWNEDRKDQHYINRISTSINKELVETNDDIADKLVKQRMLIDSLDFYLKDDQISLYGVVEKAQGIFVPTIKINSWKAISSSKIELMDYDKVSILADIEEQAELLRLKTEKLLDLIYTNYKETGEDKKEFLKMSMLEIMNTEIELKKDIEKISTE